MFGLVVTLLISWLGAALIGTVTGLFWLTLTALGGLLVTGAMGVSLRLSSTEDTARLSSVEEDATPAGRSSRLRSVPVERPVPRSGRPQDDAAPRRAA